MGVLKVAALPASALSALALLAPAACYGPRLPDCTVECMSDLDCGPDQSCGPEHYCVSPDLTCPPDQSGPGPGPARPDAGADAASPTYQLRVVIQDHGEVAVAPGVGTCDASNGGQETCTFTTSTRQITLQATPHSGYRFDKWTSTCSGSSPACALTLTAPLTEVRAKFRPE
jgi:hypothetical protein